MGDPAQSIKQDDLFKIRHGMVGELLLELRQGYLAVCEIQHDSLRLWQLSVARPYLVREELHGGEVSASSDGLGRGSEFTIRLPLDLTAPVGPDCEQTRAGRARRSVLVIEDNVDAAESLREVLEIAGHEVAIAYSGSDGIAQARKFHPDVVLCDIGLPGMDGYAVARAFRADEELRGVRLVAVSGYALPDDLQRAAEAGFEKHLAKPPTLEKLESVLGEG